MTFKKKLFALFLVVFITLPAWAGSQDDLYTYLKQYKMKEAYKLISQTKPDALSNEEKFEFYLNRSYYYLKHGYTENIKGYLKKADKIINSVNNPILKTRYNLLKAYYYALQNKPEADPLVENLSKATLSISEKAYLLKTKGVIESKKGNIENAKEYFITSAELYKKENKPYKAAESYAHSLQLLQDNELMEKEIKTIAQSLNISETYFYKTLAHTYCLNKEYDKALTLYNKANTINGNDSYACYRMARIYQEYKKEYDKSIEWFKKAIEIDPEYKSAYNNIGVVYENQKEYDKAIEWFKKAIEIDPEYTDAYYNIGWVYKNQKEYDKAIEWYKKAIEIDPKYTDAYRNIGNVYYNQKEYDKAIEWYYKAIEIDPEYTEAYRSIGVVYSDQKEYDKAIEWFKKTIEIDPEYTDAYFSIGWVYSDQKEYDKAIEWYYKAIEIDPKYTEAYRSIGVVYENQKEYDKAIEWYKKAIKIDPEYTRAYNNIGFVYEKQKEYDKAIEWYKKAIEIDPKNAHINWVIGNLYKNKNELDKAIEWYKKVLEIDQNHSKTLLDIAQILINNNNYFLALNFLHHLDEINPNQFNTLQKIASCYIQMGELEQGKKYREKTIQCSKNISNKTDIIKLSDQKHLIGNLYTDLEESKKAIEWYKKAIEIDPTNYMAYGNLAHRYKEDKEKQIYYLKKAVEINPKYTWALEKLGGVFEKLEDYEQAVYYLEQATKFDDWGRGRYNQLGDIYRDHLKDDAKAYECYKKELEKNPGYYCARKSLFKIMKDETKEQDISKMIDEIENNEFVGSYEYYHLGRFLFDIKEYDKAIQYLKKCIELRAYVNDSNVYYLIAEAYLEKGQYQKAIDWYEKYEAFNPGSTLFKLGYCYSNLNKPQKAIEYYEKYLEESLNEPAPINNIGSQYQKLKDYDQAEKYFKEAVTMALEEKKYDKLALYYNNLAILYKIQDKKDLIIQYAESSIDAHKKYVNSLFSEQKKLETCNNFYAYNLAINAYYEKGNYDRLFELIEETKYFITTQQIAKKNAVNKTKIPLEKRVKLKTLKEKVDFAFGEIKNLKAKQITDKAISMDSQKSIELTNEYNQAMLQFKEYDKQLREDYPEYQALSFPKTITFEETKKILKDNLTDKDAILYNYYTYDYVYIVLLTRDDIKIERIDLKVEQLEEYLAGYLGVLKAASCTNNYDNLIHVLGKFDQKAAHNLYKVLIQPVEKHIKQGDKYIYENIVVIPDGLLSKVPYETLITKDEYTTIEEPGVALSQFKDIPFLIKDVNLSYAQSFQLLKTSLEKKERTPKNKKLLIVANPDIKYLQSETEKWYDKQLKNPEVKVEHKTEILKALDTRDGLILSLPFSEEEGIFIKNLYGDKADLLTTDNATEGNFKSKLGQYENYHISSHGFMDEEDPYMSGLVLSRDNKQDGIFYAYELNGKNLEADTVVLSACETGSGKITGEGIIGLSRSFLMAGADSLVLSLWKVSDKGSCILMKNFYELKDNNIPKGEALSRAKLSMFDEKGKVSQTPGYESVSYAHPYFWSAFVLSGKWR